MSLLIRVQNLEAEVLKLTRERDEARAIANTTLEQLGDRNRELADAEAEVARLREQALLDLDAQKTLVQIGTQRRAELDAALARAEKAERERNEAVARAADAEKTDRAQVFALLDALRADLALELGQADARAGRTAPLTDNMLAPISNEVARRERDEAVAVAFARGALIGELTRECDKAEAEVTQLKVERGAAHTFAKVLARKESEALAEVARLKESLAVSFRVDGRLSPEYEKGWNDAVSHLIAAAEVKP